MNLITSFFNETIEKNTSKTRYLANTANLKSNAILFDVKFKVPADYTGKWDFLKKIFVTVALRVGSGNGSATNLISSCSLYQLLAFSDYTAGVSMGSTNFVANTIARISGAIPVGFFSMGARDSLDAIVNIDGSDVLPANPITLSIGSIFQKETVSSIMTYQATKPTGAMQPYTNVLACFYDGDEIVNKEINIIGQCNDNQNVNIEDAIALSNAEGNFEFFTRFGRFYQEPFGLSENISFKCPVDDPNAEILVVGYHFDDSLLISNAAETEATRNKLITSIRETDEQKYNYLKARGLV